MDRYQRTFQTWNKVASLYQDTFMDIELYNDTYDSFCQLIPKRGARIFEIGCGPGNITRYLLSRRPDLDIEAIDISPNMIELARLNNPAADFKVMDCRDIDKLDAKFDGVMCGFCMPYLSQNDCAKLIVDCSSLLNVGGLLYFSTIEGDYCKSGYESSSSGKDSMYVYYYEEDYLRLQLRVSNFELLSLTRKEYSGKNGAASTHMIFIAKRE